jgi:hypothetical protein
MIKKYTPEYMDNHRGCYSSDKMKGLVNGKDLTIQDFLNWDIPIKDKFYFVRNYTELTLIQKQQLSLNCAKVVLPIYENKYPNDNRVRNCIEATEKYLKGEITKEELRTYAAAVYAAADTAAAYAAAYAADAAAYAAGAAGAVAMVAAMAAYAYAAVAAKSDYTEQLLNMLKQFCIEQDETYFNQ